MNWEYQYIERLESYLAAYRAGNKAGREWRLSGYCPDFATLRKVAMDNAHSYSTDMAIAAFYQFGYEDGNRGFERGS